jgi:hypothetical protein
LIHSTASCTTPLATVSVAKPKLFRSMSSIRT